MNAIVIADKNWAIGREGGLLFNLPTDMKRFRQLTLNGTIIVGRKTLESFPEHAPLPKRRNVVITRNPDRVAPGAVVVSNTDAAMEAVAGDDTDTVWVCGGGSVYAALLSRCKKVYLTKVDAAASEPDTFFPNLDRLPGWEVVNTSEDIEENGMKFRFIEYVNNNI